MDGVVIGVDLQHTKDVVKTAGPKLFPLYKFYDGKTYSVLIAGVGNSISAKKIVELFDESLPGDFTFTDFVAYAEGILLAFHERYILPLTPGDMRYECQLMFAVRINRESRLYVANGLMIAQQNEPVCMGEGLYIGDYLLEAFLPHTSRTVEVASQFVAHAIHAAKDYITSVGKGTSIHILREDGTHTGVLRPERIKIEEDFGNLFKSFSDLIVCCDTDIGSDETVTIYVDALRRAIDALRKSDVERKDLRRRRSQPIATKRESTMPQKGGAAY
jgi:hypothetical protein